MIKIAFEYSEYNNTEDLIKGVVQITAPETQQPKIHEIVLVVDLSGSMMQTLPLVKNLIEYMLEKFVNTAACSIVGFKDTADVYQKLQAITKDNCPEIMNNVASLKAGGCTNLHTGLMLGLQQFSSNPKTVKSLLLITDGFANVGMTSAPGIMKAVHDTKTTAIIYTIAIGTQCNHDLLANMTEVGGGMYTPIRQQSELVGAMGGTLGAVFGTQMRNVLLSLPGTKNLSGYPETGEDILIGCLLGGEVISVPFQTQSAIVKCELSHSEGKSKLIEVTVPRGDNPKLNADIYAHILRGEVIKFLQDNKSATEKEAGVLLTRCLDQSGPVFSMLVQRLTRFIQCSQEEREMIRQGAILELTRQRSQAYEDTKDTMVPVLMRRFSHEARRFRDPQPQPKPESLALPLTPPSLARF